MSEFDADLKRLFAQSREDLDGAAFIINVEHKISRARKVGYLGDIALALMIALGVFLGAPVMTDIFGTATADIVDTSLTVSTTPVGAWATAVAASVAALVWARA